MSWAQNGWAALSCLSIAAVEPECVNGLIDENLIPMVRLGSPQAFQETFQVIRVIGTNVSASFAPAGGSISVIN